METVTRTRQRPALQRVVDTADRLFYSSGIHSTGVDLVASEAGVSKATLYTYFPTKDHLVVNYLRRRSSTWRDHLTAELDRRRGAGREKLLAVFDILGEWIGMPGYHGCPFNNAEAEYGADAPTHDVARQHREWLRAIFTQLVAEAGVVDAEPVARQLCLLYDGVMSSAQAEPEVDWIAPAKRAVDTLLGG